MTSYVHGPTENGQNGQVKYDVQGMNEEDFMIEDDESNSAKLFERSRIRALAGLQFS